MQVAVDVLHTLGAEVALGYHLHFQLGALYGVALAYHGAEDTVSGEVGVASYQQVTAIHAVYDASVQWEHGGEQALHLLQGIGDEHSLEVVAILEAVADARCDTVHVLQHTGIFYAHHVLRHLGLHVVALHALGKGLCLVQVGAADGQVREPVQRHLLGMARSAYDGQILVGHIIDLVEVFRTDKVLVGHDTLDGRYQELVAQAHLQFLQVSLQVGRGRYEHQCLAVAHHLVDV